MSYRPDHAGFELNIGSAIAAVLPASGIASAIGSACVLAFVLITEIVGSIEFSAGGFIAVILGALVFLAIGTLIGTFFCAFYIGLIGVPLASLLGQRITKLYAIPISLVAALATSYLAATVLVGDFLTWDATDKWKIIGLMLAYSVPAGLMFRDFVIAERSISVWS